MRYFKYLVVLLVVSCITSISGIRANFSDPYFFKTSCSGFNGSVYTGTRLKEEFHTQELRWTVSERELDVVLQDKSGNNVSPWFTLKTGIDIIFNNEYAMMASKEYRVFVDSRINYLTKTDFEFKWWIH